MLSAMIVLLATITLGKSSHATEAAARLQNYDRWKDLPSQALLDKGYSYWRVDQMDSALVCFMILSNRYNEKLSATEKGYCCEATLRVAKLYMHYFCDYQMSYRYLLKADKMSQENHFQHLSSDICESMAVLQVNRIEIENNNSYNPEILKLFKNSFNHAVTSRHYIVACISFFNLSYDAMKYRHVGDIHDEVLAFRSLLIPDSIPFKPYMQQLCEGVMAMEKNDYQGALDIFSQLEKFLPQDDSPKSIARKRTMTHVLRYTVLLSLNRDTEALQEIDNAEKNERDNQLYDAITELLRIKQDYYEEHGNPAMAREYKLKYFEAKDEFINRSKLLNVEQQKFLLEIEEMGEKVKDLETQKRIRDIVLAAVILLALLTIGILIYVWRNYQSTKQRNLVQYQRIQELLALERERNNKQGEKYKSSPMDEQAKDELLQRVYAAMESHQEVYGDGFTLDQLARLVESSPNYVSQVINEKKGCNFNAFVNEYRIKEACRRLSDVENYGGLTVEAVGQSLGFKSRTNFTAIFKKFTGMTPAAYQRMARSGAPLVAATGESQNSPA